MSVVFAFLGDPVADVLDDIAGIFAGQILDTVEILTPGSGYDIDDNISITGGTSVISNSITQFRVRSVDENGGVTSIHSTNNGSYTSIPSSPASGATPSGGTAATFNLTYKSTPWTVERNTFSSPEREIILSSTSGVYVGMRTFTLNSQQNIELAGFSGYSSGDTWNDQPGISPGRFDGGGESGAFLPMAGATAYSTFIYFNERRIMMRMAYSSIRQTCYMGLLRPVYPSAAPAGYIAEPAPMYICGSYTNPDELLTTSLKMHLIVNPISTLVGSTGPGYYRDSAGSWQSVRNGYGVYAAPPARYYTRTFDNVVTPLGLSFEAITDLTDSANRIVGDLPYFGHTTGDTMPIDNLEGVANPQLFVTIPRSSGRSYTLLPCFIVSQSPARVIGQIEGIWLLPRPSKATLSSRIYDGENRGYTVLSGNYSVPMSVVAMEEA